MNQKRIFLILFVAVICLISVFQTVSGIFRFFEENSFHFPRVGISEVMEYTPVLFYKASLFSLFSVVLFWRYFWETNLKLKKLIDNPQNNSWMMNKRMILSKIKIEVLSDFSSSAFEWIMSVKVLETKKIPGFV